MLKIKNFFLSLFEKSKTSAPLVGLFLLIFLPVNFFCQKEKFWQQKNLAGWEMAFENSALHISTEKALLENTAFYLSTQNSTKKTCQLTTFLSDQKLTEEKVSFKKEKKIFSLSEATLQTIKKEKGGRLEIQLECENYRDNIYKYLTL